MATTKQDGHSITPGLVMSTDDLLPVQIFSKMGPHVDSLYNEHDGGAGVLYLYGNYGGDVFNFDLAVDLAELEGIETKTVLGRDDVASQPNERKHDRRGVAGIFFAYKLAGAAAERGDSLADVAAVAEDAVEHCATMGIGLAPTILPTTGKPSFELPDGEMEIGIGIHGEPGIHRGPLETADEIAEHLELFPEA